MAQDFAEGKFSLGWCPQNRLVALDAGTEVPAGLGPAQKYTDSGLDGDSVNPWVGRPEDTLNWRKHSLHFLGTRLSLKSVWLRWNVRSEPLGNPALPCQQVMLMEYPLG